MLVEHCKYTCPGGATAYLVVSDVKAEINFLIEWGHLVPKKIWCPKSFGPKNFEPEKFWSRKDFGSRIFFTKKYCQKKSCVKNLGSEKMFGLKKFWPRKKFGSINF